MIRASHMTHPIYQLGWSRIARQRGGDKRLRTARMCKRVDLNISLRELSMNRKSTTMRLVVCLLLCGVIAASNDTLSNVIPSDEQLNLGEHEEEDNPTKNETLHEVFEDAVQAYLEEDWDRCIEGFNAVTHGYA